MNKNFSWPNDSKLAISMVVNVEEGAEENINDGDLRPDPVDELQVVMKKGRNYGNETNYQYGIKAGAPRILKLLSDFNIKATFTSAALALERAPKLAKAIVNKYTPSPKFFDFETSLFIRTIKYSKTLVFCKP